MPTVNRQWLLASRPVGFPKASDFRTKQDGPLERTGVFHECAPGRHKPVVKIVELFGDNPMTIAEVRI
jgi:hypothetical protein